MKRQKDGGKNNRHGTALVAGETGILILGPSGSGKSRLALEFMQSAAVAGRFSALVADDQVLLDEFNGRLVAMAPEPIAGLLEIRGSAIVSVHHLPRAVIHMLVRIRADSEEERLPDPEEALTLGSGISLPVLHMKPGTLPDPLILVDDFLQRGC
ncbi:MAG: HPr kinase/phosphatase C-terminal domain-containing protein [Pseudomonadota bacterium]